MNTQTFPDNNPPQSNLPESQSGGVPPTAVKILFLSYEGRLGRLPYFLYGLLLNIVAIPVFFATLFVLVQIGGEAPEFPGGESGLLITALVIVGIPYLIVGLPLIVKRLHDFGQSGALAVVFLIVSAIPIVNLLAGLAMILIPGTQGPNEYGPETGFAFSRTPSNTQ